jgi:hypothetical protein
VFLKHLKRLGIHHLNQGIPHTRESVAHIGDPRASQPISGAIDRPRAHATNIRGKSRIKLVQRGDWLSFAKKLPRRCVPDTHIRLEVGGDDLFAVLAKRRLVHMAIVPGPAPYRRQVGELPKRDLPIISRRYHHPVGRLDRHRPDPAIMRRDLP